MLIFTLDDILASEIPFWLSAPIPRCPLAFLAHRWSPESYCCRKIYLRARSQIEEEDESSKTKLRLLGCVIVRAGFSQPLRFPLCLSVM